MTFRKGMAGLVLLVMMIGYMMAISVSNTVVIQSESAGKSARNGYKNAYYSALAGVGAVMARLRVEPTTFDIATSTRPYFVRVANDADNHYCEWVSAARTYSGGTRLIAPGWLQISSPFTINTDAHVEDYSFLICSYSKSDAATGEDYYMVKSQGKFVDFDGGKTFQAQIWARIKVNAPAKLLQLESFGAMGVQSTSIAAGTAVNDFWDWQANF